MFVVVSHLLFVVVFHILLLLFVPCRVRLDGIQNALKNPAQYKGRLNELISQVRLQSQSGLSLAQQQFTIEPQTLAEYKEVIKEQQEGISQLVKIVKEDSEDVSVIEEGLTAASR
jgi:predicted PurR-regulated permease PerM